jgi:hypothetical protein
MARRAGAALAAAALVLAALPAHAEAGAHGGEIRDLLFRRSTSRS